MLPIGDRRGGVGPVWDGSFLPAYFESSADTAIFATS